MTFQDSELKDKKVATILEWENRRDPPYCSFITDRKGNLVCYYKLSGAADKSARHLGIETTAYIVSEDGINFSEPTVVLAENHTCHNFFPFYDPKTDTYKAISGKCFSRIGGYLQHFESVDGYQWKRVNAELISGRHPGLPGDVETNSTIDGGLCAFYDMEKGVYKMYIRTNLGTGRRKLYLVESRDFVKWTEAKPLTFEPEFREARRFKQNYYFASVWKQNGLYCALMPYFQLRNKPFAENRVMTSEDGIHWIKQYGLFHHKLESHHTRTEVLPCCGKHEKYLYFFEGYKMPTSYVNAYDMEGYDYV